MSAAANSATSPLPSAPDVEVDVGPDEEVEDEYAEEPSSCARFDDTDDEEREENIDSLVLQEYDGED